MTSHSNPRRDMNPVQFFDKVAEMREAQKEYFRTRNKEALSRKRAEGVVLGRPKGRKTTPEKHKLYNKRHLIKALLEENVSKRKIAKICKCDRNTLSRYISNIPRFEQYANTPKP